MDTIFAVATAPGRSGISIVRVSGHRVLEACNALGFRIPESHRPVLRTLRVDGAIIDRALVLAFEKGRSFTGEPVVELHVHGSVAVVKAILACLATLPGLRIAEAGEFTRRALENGRLTLTEVEGLADLLMAETEAQRRQAVRVFSGELARSGERWRSKLLFCRAQVEALIDFADQGLDDTLDEGVVSEISSVGLELSAVLSNSRGAERIAEGFEVAFVGEPNVGKSTLLNKIAGREAALTSDVAGTTRDVIELRYDLQGLPVMFLDTAGVRASLETVEMLGIERTKDRAARADMRIFLGCVPEGFEFGPDDLLVGMKSDIEPSEHPLAVSGRTGDGVDRLLEAIYGVLEKRAPSSVLLIRERQRAALQEALEALLRAQAVLEDGSALEFVAEELRAATHGLETLLGRVGIEEILGEIFSSFCIGK